jgi:hypothetical protein
MTKLMLGCMMVDRDIVHNQSLSGGSNPSVQPDRSPASLGTISDLFEENVDHLTVPQATSHHATPPQEVSVSNCGSGMWSPPVA